MGDIMQAKIRGVNNADVRTTNKQNLIMLLYNGGRGFSRQDISRAMSLSLPTVNLLLGQLEEEGLLIHHCSEVSSGGRLPELFYFNKDAAYFFGIEIAKEEVRILLLNLGGEIVASRSMRENFCDEGDYWAGIGKTMRGLIEEAAIDPAKLAGSGAAIPGVVRKEEKRVDFAATLGLKNWYYDKLGELIGFPINLVENEANAAGFAEVWTQEEVDNAVYVSITKGVGGAIILQGEILNGFQSRSGEFGHMLLYPGGKKCSCGKNGCFEAYCSTKELTKLVDSARLEDFFTRKKTDPALQAAWEDYLGNLTVGLSNLSIQWDLPIIIGGNIRDHLEEDFAGLEKMVEKLIPFEISAKLLRLSENKSDGSARGVALMLISKYIETLCDNYNKVNPKGMA